MNILSNKTQKTSKYFSRYTGLDYYYNNLDGRYQLHTGAWLQQTDQYTTYIVKDKDTYDSIALATYGNPTYYWLICDFNHVIDPFKELKEGDILYLPVLGSDIKYETY